MSRLIEKLHFASGLAPVADALAGTVGSDVVNMEEHGKVIFIIHKGVGTTGTSTITVEACDDVTPSNTSAVPFHYKAITSTDVNGTVTAADADGFALTAGSAQIYAVEVDSTALAADGNGYGYVRLKAVEVVDSAVLAGILIVMAEPRYGVTSATRTQLA